LYESEFAESALGATPADGGALDAISTGARLFARSQRLPTTTPSASKTVAATADVGQTHIDRAARDLAREPGKWSARRVFRAASILAHISSRGTFGGAL
jgi:hypothetical protein